MGLDDTYHFNYENFKLLFFLPSFQGKGKMKTYWLLEKRADGTSIVDPYVPPPPPPQKPPKPPPKLSVMSTVVHAVSALSTKASSSKASHHVANVESHASSQASRTESLTAGITTPERGRSVTSEIGIDAMQSFVVDIADFPTGISLRNPKEKE